MNNVLLCDDSLRSSLTPPSLNRLSSRLAEVAPFVITCAGDVDAQVRECACFALGQLAEHCQPEILNFAPQILEAVFKLLDDASISVQTTSCYVLEMFCEHLEPEQIGRFLDPLTRKLVSMLEVATRKCVREMAVAALAATAVAAEKVRNGRAQNAYENINAVSANAPLAAVPTAKQEFIPYLPAVANIMGRLMVLNTEDQYPLKGRAMECMGHMAVAVEKDAFRPYFQETMRCTCEALTLDSVELHEYAYAVFANLSKVMEREFSPVLPELVPHMWKLIGQSDGQGTAKEQKEVSAYTDNSSFATISNGINTRSSPRRRYRTSYTRALRARRTPSSPASTTLTMRPIQTASGPSTPACSSRRPCSRPRRPPSPRSERWRATAGRTSCPLSRSRPRSSRRRGRTGTRASSSRCAAGTRAWSFAPSRRTTKTARCRGRR